jgi:hypothetical protein
MSEWKIRAEEGGVQLRLAPAAGRVEVTILKDGQVIATATIARWRWDQATLPAPAEVVGFV